MNLTFLESLDDTDERFRKFNNNFLIFKIKYSILICFRVRNTYQGEHYRDFDKDSHHRGECSARVKTEEGDGHGYGKFEEVACTD